MIETTLSKHGKLILIFNGYKYREEAETGMKLYGVAHKKHVERNLKKR
jgi:hypothetical protein